jgi:hypothetical protein
MLESGAAFELRSFKPNLDENAKLGLLSAGKIRAIVVCLDRDNVGMRKRSEKGDAFRARISGRSRESIGSQLFKIDPKRPPWPKKDCTKTTW